MAIARRTTVFAVAVVAVTLLALGGCAAEQTKADACDQVRSGLENVPTELNENLANYQDDPDSAVAAINDLAASFAENASQITNTEVKEAADNTAGVLTTMAEQFAAFVENPEAEENSDLLTTASDMETSFATLQAVCG